MDIDEVLARGVDKVYPSREALKKAMGGKKLRIYQGFDPTGTELHIGHMVGFRKLAQLQKLGHHVIFLIGDGTGQAGDPSGKTKSRDKFLTNKELRDNAKSYVEQAGKIVDFGGNNPIEILYNGDWLNKLSLEDILDIAGHFSLQQLIERDLFQERLKNKEEINLREFLYPLLQGYDSVAMNVDLEVGGSDQTFNMLCGRQLVKQMQGREKFVLTTPLLTDSQGVKIGKTEGNVIALTDKPADLFGKIMSLSDDVIVKGLEYLTDVPTTEIEEIEKKIKNGDNPMQYKKKLAAEIVEQLNDKKAAENAQDAFESTFQKREDPQEAQEIAVTDTISISDLLTANSIITSTSQVKNLIREKAIEINGKVVTSPKEPVSAGQSIKVGKKTFIKTK
ncbi:tyrosine--tRNA ligase [Candidatus Curtissbacteria bacterium]|nr:tyrosine--tRNA ligase [Candidatus Curtissbacteria bacterium]